MGAKNKKVDEAELRCVSSASSLAPTSLSVPWHIAREHGYHREGQWCGRVVLSCFFPAGFSETIVQLGALVGFEGAGRAWVTVMNRAVLTQIVNGNWALDCSNFVELMGSHLHHAFEGGFALFDHEQEMVWGALASFTNDFALAVLVDEARRPFLKGAARAAGEINAVMAAKQSGFSPLG